MFMTDVLRRCSDLEQRVADIYRHFAGSLHDDRELASYWLGMAEEEKHHGKILAAEHAALEVDSDTGYFMPEFPAKLTEMDALLTWTNFFARNLLPVTIGNVIGGVFLVGLVYWFIYLRSAALSASPKPVGSTVLSSRTRRRAGARKNTSPEQAEEDGGKTRRHCARGYAVGDFGLRSRSGSYRVR